MAEEIQRNARPVNSGQSGQDNQGDQGDATLQAEALRPVEASLSLEDHADKPGSDIAMRTIHVGS